MNRSEILSCFFETDDEKLDWLWQTANDVRRVNVGDGVHLRALIEFSNICNRRCAYCGLGSDNRRLIRYSMDADEIIDTAKKAFNRGFRTVVLQSGENHSLDAEWFAEIIAAIKNQSDIAVTLSVGDYEKEVYHLWKDAGADRYLLKFETSNEKLFGVVHPDSKYGLQEKTGRIADLRELGYEVGSGLIVGLPGQSYSDLAGDLLLLKDLDLDMITAGPYIAHSQTELGLNQQDYMLPTGEQVPVTDLMVYKVMALIRIMFPKVNIPTTTSISVLNPDSGCVNALQRGCNVVMPNVTPAKYRAHYEIYPHKSEIQHDSFETEIKEKIIAIGRQISSDKGFSAGFLKRNSQVTN